PRWRPRRALDRTTARTTPWPPDRSPAPPVPAPRSDGCLVDLTISTFGPSRGSWYDCLTGQASAHHREAPILDAERHMSSSRPPSAVYQIGLGEVPATS